MVRVDGVAKRIRRAVVAGLAMTASGCGPTVVVPDGDTGGAGGDAGDDADDEGSPVTASSTAAGDGADGTQPGTTASSSDDGFDDGNEVKTDISMPVPPPPDPPDGECFVAPPDEPLCPVMLGPQQVVGYRCIPEDVETECQDLDGEEVFDEAQTCLGCGGFIDSVQCGPIAAGGSCCHWIVYEPGQSCPGRPFTVGGVARVPQVVRRSDWKAEVPVALDGLDAPTRSTLAEAWGIEGCYEAASVASFSRFALELLAVGAPAQLVADTQRALAEEVGHARAFFGLASVYGGDDVGPGTLGVGDALAESSDIEAIVEALAREGCIGETVSALQLQVAARRVADPPLRALLLDIAEEELRHAELAWRAMGWLVATGGDSVRRRVAATFARANEFIPRSTTASDALPPSTLADCGRLGRDERLDLAERALATLVAPAAAALLRGWTTDATDAVTRA